MSQIEPVDLQLITYETSPATSPIPSFPGVQNMAFKDCQQLRNYAVNNSKTYSFIILCLNSDGHDPGLDFEDLKKKTSIFACFFCVKLKANFTHNGTNVFPVTEQFLTQKITSYIIKFYEQTSEKLMTLGHRPIAVMFQEKADNIRKTRRLSSKMIHAPHVLIIPINVTEDCLFGFQERIIDACKDLCCENEPTVCTLDDYYPYDKDLNFCGDRYVAAHCKFIKRLAPIRLYLIGNETHNSHLSSRTVFESESNDCGRTKEYDDNYTLVEYQPVTEQTRRNLSTIIGSRCESEDIHLKRLDDLRNDIQFAAALERVNVNKKARATAAQIELNRAAADPADNSVEISASYQVIGQPVSVPGTQYT